MVSLVLLHQKEYCCFEKRRNMCFSKCTSTHVVFRPKEPHTYLAHEVVYLRKQLGDGPLLTPMHPGRGLGGGSTVASEGRPYSLALFMPPSPAFSLCRCSFLSFSLLAFSFSVLLTLFCRSPFPVSYEALSLLSLNCLSPMRAHID